MIYKLKNLLLKNKTSYLLVKLPWKKKLVLIMFELKDRGG